jgi:hypothetical protein
VAIGDVVAQAYAEIKRKKEKHSHLKMWQRKLLQSVKMLVKFLPFHLAGHTARWLQVPCKQWKLSLKRRESCPSNSSLMK